MDPVPHTHAAALPARVNDVEISLAAIEAESRNYAQDPEPALAARRVLVAQELLRQRAVTLDVIGPHDALDDEKLDALLEREVRVPEPTREDCLRYFEQHASQFVRGELVYASHILFAVTDGVPLVLLREKAEETLRDVQRAPDTFEALARRFSNCPSAGVGGSLGQLARGDSVPEFEAALFDSTDVGVLPRLVRTRYGFHLVRIDRRVPGEPIAFEDVQSHIARFLVERTRGKAIQQYVSILASEASLENAALDSATGPLVQ